MANAAPKLPPSTTGNLPSYAPISWTAVSALAAAGLFFLIIFITGSLAFLRNQSLIQPWLLFFAILAVVLAFVARLQIRASEGTRTGEKYANIAWYLGVVGGLGYMSYMLGVEYAVRIEAEKQFLTFAENLQKVDPNNPDDPALYAAIYETINPGRRSSLPETDYVQALNTSFKDNVLGFKASDLARVVLRNAGDCNIKISGFVDWNQSENDIRCTLKANLSCPEGDHDLIVPMRAEIDAKKQRRWFIEPNKEGYIKGRKLTPYGWELAALEVQGQELTNGLIDTLLRGNNAYAYFAFIDPRFNPQSANDFITSVMDTTEQRMAATGSWGALIPRPEQYEQTIFRNVFSKPDGKAATDYELALFKAAWNFPQRLGLAGRTVKSNVDTFQAILLHGQKIEYQQAAELILSPEGQQPPTARARIIWQLSNEEDGKLREQLTKLRTEAVNAPRTVSPNSEQFSQPRVWNWRVVKISSDLKQIPVDREQIGAGGGLGGLGGGMMGG